MILKKAKMKESLTFKEFSTKLRYTMNDFSPINEEFQSIAFPEVCTTSQNEFIKYFLSASQYFGHYLKVYKSDSMHHSYIFNCSVNGCYMRVGFHKESDNILCLNKNTSYFEHNEKSHELNKPNIRMLQKIFDDFIEYSKNGGDIANFFITHKDLENIPKKKLYDIKTKLNLELNNIESLIEILNKNENFISSIIKDQNGILCG